MVKVLHGGAPGDPRLLWPLRRAAPIRAVLLGIVAAAAASLGVIALVTAGFVTAFGHPLLWSVLGAVFALPPLGLLASAVLLSHRAAIGAGDRWVGIRTVGQWRVVDFSAPPQWGARRAGGAHGEGPGPGTVIDVDAVDEASELRAGRPAPPAPSAP